MKLEDFKKKLDGHSVYIIDYVGDEYREWDQLNQMKLLTEYIPFKCKFENGRCQAVSNTHRTEACCCINCSLHLGYLRLIKEEYIPYYTKKFHSKYGFWRKGKGCILDRQYRSSVCVSFQCSEACKDNFSEHMLAYREVLYDLESKIMKIRSGGKI